MKWNHCFLECFVHEASLFPSALTALPHVKLPYATMSAVTKILPPGNFFSNSFAVVTRLLYVYPQSGQDWTVRRDLSWTVLSVSVQSESSLPLTSLVLDTVAHTLPLLSCRESAVFYSLLPPEIKKYGWLARLHETTCSSPAMVSSAALPSPRPISTAHPLPKSSSWHPSTSASASTTLQSLAQTQEHNETYPVRFPDWPWRRTALVTWHNA